MITNKSIKNDPDYSQISPVIAILSLLMGIVGSATICLGSILLVDEPTEFSGMFLALLGGTLNFMAWLSLVLYPWAYRWLNR